jgi:hypothetical protein
VRNLTAGDEDEQPSGRKAVTFSKTAAAELLNRLDRPAARLALPAAGDGPTALLPVSERFNTVIGCKTDEVGLTLLAQIVKLEADDLACASDERTEELLMKATAMLAELEPATATESMLAAQMIGAQRMVMKFLERSMLPGQTTAAIDANINRAAKLMRIFNEQVETMAKLKGKSGQQRVVVEHVNVEPGGQAIVGTVIPEGSRGIARTTRSVSAWR